MGVDGPQDIRRRTLTGLAWTAASTLGQQALQFGFIAVLARLIVPRDFGLIAMIAVVAGFAALFVDLGLSAALVQRPTIEERHLNSAFWLNLTLGALAMLAIMGLAPAIAAFYNEPRLIALTLASAPSFLIASLSGVQAALLQRRMSFRRLVVLENAAFVAGNLVGIGMALAGYGVWSFIALGLTTAGMKTGLLWVSSGWRPSRRPDRLSISELWHYSSRLTGFNVVNYWARNADTLLIGRFIGTTSLAYYDRAYNIMLAPTDLVGSVTSRVMFPALSRIRENSEQTKRVYLRSIGLIGLIIFPTVIGLFVLARPFVLTVFGPHWLPAVPVLEILCVCAFLQGLFQTTGWIFTSQGRTDLLFRWGLVATVTIVIGFVIGLHWGLRGVASSYAICNLLVAVPAFWSSGRLIGVSLADVGRALLGVAGTAAVMGVAVWLVELLVRPRYGASVQLVVGVLTGIATYALALHTVSPRPYRELKNLRTEFGL